LKNNSYTDLDEYFREYIKGAQEKYCFILHGYVLMTNHYHLIIETPDGNLSQGMRQLNGVYTQLFNKRHNRVGHIIKYKGLFKKDSRQAGLTLSSDIIVNKR
jgi:REP element-mobilizing transposase RayT